jgi:hypothetical protein
MLPAKFVSTVRTHDNDRNRRLVFHRTRLRFRFS